MMKNILITTRNRSLVKNIALPLMLAILPVIATAGSGHDHGEAAPTTGVSSLLRFSAVSDMFELVGVVDGKKVTLFLDRAQTNEAIKQAKIDLELDGTKLKLTPAADGEFVAELAAPLKEGVISVTATVTVGEETDLLAGELDLHLDDHAAEAAHSKLSRWHIAGAISGGLALIALLIALFQRARRNKNQSKYSGGAI